MPKGDADWSMGREIAQAVKRLSPHEVKLPANAKASETTDGERVPEPCGTCWGQYLTGRAFDLLTGAGKPEGGNNEAAR